MRLATDSKSVLRTGMLPLLSPRRRRGGISLFEVVLALSIYLGALAMISQILRTGSRASIRAQLSSQAAQLCDHQMNKMVSGIEPLDSVSSSPVENHPNWSWTATVTDGPLPYLLLIELTVEHQSSNSEAQVKHQLNRYVRDPEYLNDAPAGEGT